MFQAAFYKGTRPGFQGNYNRFIRAWEHGKYSHGELLFSDGMSGSSSLIDKGVRIKRIEYDPERWDFVSLPQHLEPYARDWFETRAGLAGYDLLGQLRFVWMPVRIGNNDFRYWCTEAMAAALRMQDPWRYGPNGLAAALKDWQRLMATLGLHQAAQHAIGA